MRAWKRSGGAPRWLVVARRGGSSSRSASRTSTPARNTPQASLGFPREARITRGAELQRIAREGKRIRTTHLEVRAAASPLARPVGSRTRVGLVVPRYKHSAVDRNRLKRRLRELSRIRLLPTDLAADIVLRIRPDAYTASFEALTADVERALTQLQRWRPTVTAAAEGGPTAVLPPSDTSSGPVT